MSFTLALGDVMEVGDSVYASPHNYDQRRELLYDQPRKLRLEFRRYFIPDSRFRHACWSKNYTVLDKLCAMAPQETTQHLLPSSPSMTPIQDVTFCMTVL